MQAARLLINRAGCRDRTPVNHVAAVLSVFQHMQQPKAAHLTAPTEQPSCQSYLAAQRASALSLNSKLMLSLLNMLHLKSARSGTNIHTSCTPVMCAWAEHSSS
eukprot:356133-Chlamydomonas_euryale.AAC.21